ncbi:MAG: DNA translocase FtsK 4TM domain-containing protein [Anaerolineales bacterium]|nr:DNA translocase FtsK 4TM domain-containing protein [Anaerolineales bacterium]
MARKLTKKTPSKTTSRSQGKTSRTAKPQKSPSPLWGLIKGQPGVKTPSRSTSGKPASRSSQNKTVAASRLSLDRKIDLIGIVLAFIGLLTLLSLASASQGSLTGELVGFLNQGFGWGMYFFPLGLLLIGLWLVLRTYERVPRISLERISGIVLLFANLLAWFHFFLFPENNENALQLADLGEGGGYIGAFILNSLSGGLGIGGAFIALLAWLLITLVMVFDVSVVQLFHWISPLIENLRDAWEERKLHRSKETPVSFSEFTPLTPPMLVPGRATSATQLSPDGEIFPAGLPTQTNAPREWKLPSITEILETGNKIQPDEQYDQNRARVIEETLSSFSAPAKVVEISRGPVITQFGVEPDFIESRGGRMRVRVGKIASLADDLALALSARTIRVQAPVPGKGYVGIEVPNEEIGLVALRDVIESEAFLRLKSPLRFALGENVAGKAVAADLAAMPHLLIAGATGSGKSVCVNSIIACFLMHNTPDDLRLIMVDPKRVELSNYNGIPHLLAPVVVELERVVGALQWVTREMDHRYHKLAQVGTRNITEYNAKAIASGEKKLPHLVVIIDELADLMMLAPDETERTITRLAQLARATGIHLIIATQRPSVDVVTGLIKANFPARVAFAVASGVDSRVILDQPGAERLLGRGDMLFQAPDAAAPARLQGTFVSDIEIQRLVEYWQGFNGTPAAPMASQTGAIDTPAGGLPLKQIPLWEEMSSEENVDPLFNESIDLVRRQGRASISMLQRRLRIGYTRAARLIETMEEKGIVGPPEPGTGAREVLDYGQAAPPADEN